MIAVAGNRVFVAGSFSEVNGVPRRNLAALEGTTGELEAWDSPGLLPSTIASSSVSSLSVQGDRLYLGGYFAGVGVPPENAVKLLDVNTAELSGWKTPLDGSARRIFPAGDRIYLGGFFGRVEGSHRVGVAAVETGSAALLPWAPELTGGCVPGVGAILASGTTVYMGGVFTSVSGVARSNAVAVDAASGSVLPWDPSVESDFQYCGKTLVSALAMHGHDLWLGGSFTSMHGQAVPYLAVVDDQIGQLTTFRPGCDGSVEALLVSGDTVFVAGAFQRLAGQPQRGLGVFVLGGSTRSALAAPAVAVPRQLRLSPVMPNPVTSRAVLRFVLPEAGSVDVAVYDIQGRRAAMPLEGQRLEAGPHEITLTTGSWRPGFYFCRLSAGGQTRIQKLLVVR